MSINNRQIKTNGDASNKNITLTFKKDVNVHGKEYKAGEQISCSKSVAIDIIKRNKSGSDDSGKVFDIKMD